MRAEIHESDVRHDLVGEHRVGRARKPACVLIATPQPSSATARSSSARSRPTPSKAESSTRSARPRSARRRKWKGAGSSCPPFSGMSSAPEDSRRRYDRRPRSSSGLSLRCGKFREIQEDQRPEVWDDTSCRRPRSSSTTTPASGAIARKLLEAAGFLVVGDAEDGASALAAVARAASGRRAAGRAAAGHDRLRRREGARGVHRSDRSSSSPRAGAPRTSARSSARSMRGGSSRSET